MKKSLLFNLLVCFSLLWVSCKSDSSKDTQEKEMVEIYSIVLANDTTKIGKLTYKDVKFLNDEGKVVKQEYYDKEGILKGVEYIDRTKAKRHSEYYTPDSVLLSYYDLVYDMDVLTLKSAFDGSSGEFLRAEQYRYDEAGNRLEKIILDAEGNISRVYKFVYDDHGNELGFSGFDEKGELFVMETYSITAMDDQNRWTEKWGKRDNVPWSYYKRTFAK